MSSQPIESLALQANTARKDRGVSSVIAVALVLAITVALASGIGLYVFDIVGNGPGDPAEFQSDVRVDEQGHIVIAHAGGEDVDPSRLKVQVVVQGSDGTKKGTITKFPDETPQLEESYTSGDLEFDKRWGAVSPSVLGESVASSERIGFNLKHSTAVDADDTVTVKLIDQKTNQVIDSDTVTPDDYLKNPAIPSNYFETISYSSSESTVLDYTKTIYSKTKPGDGWTRYGVAYYDTVHTGYLYTTSRYDPGPGWERTGIARYETEKTGYKYTYSEYDPGPGWERNGVAYYDKDFAGYDYKTFETLSALYDAGYTYVSSSTTITGYETVTHYEQRTRQVRDKHTSYYTDYDWHPGHYETREVCENNGSNNPFVGGTGMTCHTETYWVSGYYTKSVESYTWYTYETETYIATWTTTEPVYDTDYTGKKATYDSDPVYEWKKATYNTYAVYEWRKATYEEEPVYEWKKPVYKNTGDNLKYNGQSNYQIATDNTRMKSGKLTIEDDKLVSGTNAFTLVANGVNGERTLTVGKTSTGQVTILDNGKTVWTGSAKQVTIDLDDDKVVVSHSDGSTTTVNEDFEIGPGVDDEIGEYTLAIENGESASGSYTVTVDGNSQL